MGIVEREFDCEELHPIDIVETLAEERSWISTGSPMTRSPMAIEGSWRTYSVTLAWSARDETLRLICAFDLAPPARRVSALNAAMCLANDKCWSGAFVLWRDQKLMGYRYGLNLAGGAQASSSQINDMVRAAVMACERFYPAFQLVAWGGETPEKALGIAMTEAYGRA